MEYINAFVGYTNESLKKLRENVAKVLNAQNLKNAKNLPNKLTEKIASAISAGNEQMKNFGEPIQAFC